MRKKILSLVLTVCMVLTLLPAVSLPAAATAMVIEVYFDGAGSGQAVGYGNFAEGWNAAVGTGNTAKTTVKLLGDWRATSTSFGTGIGFGDGTDSGTGFILVPKRKHITLDLNGNTIDRGLTAAQTDGEVICIDSDNISAEYTVFTLADSAGESAGGAGDGVTGCITGGNNSGNGGGIYMAGNSVKCTIKGGCISGNRTAENGGGIVTHDTTNGDFMITGGKITGNSAAKGGGIYCTMCCDGISNCIIQGNTATTCGGGIYSDYYGGIGISGATVVSGNAHGANAVASTTDDATPGSEGATDNLYLATGSKVNCSCYSGNLASGAYIGVTTQTHPGSGSAAIAVTDGSSADYSRYFHSDYSDCHIFNDAASTSSQIVKLGYGVIEVAHDGTNFTIYGDFSTGWNNAVGTSNQSTTAVKLLTDWIAATDATYGTSFGTGGGFGDGTSTAGYIRVPASKSIALDLNGHDIDRNLTSPQGTTNANAGRVILNRGTLVIKDTSTAAVDQQGKITGGYNSLPDSSAGGIYSISSASLTIEGGQITGNKVINWGGGVFAIGTFIMTGGRISNNIANYDGDNNGGAGGVYDSSSNFTMTGGEIVGNYVCGNAPGGGLYDTYNLKIGGTAKITGNVSGATFSSTNGAASGGAADNVYLETGITVTCSTTTPLTGTSPIGVTTQTVPTVGTPVAVTGSNTGDLSGHFASDNSAYEIYDDSNTVKLRAIPTYTVTFDANGHGTAPAALTGVTSGSKITAPTEPTASGYTFGGWYKDADCTTAWDFASDTVTAATTLYAKWTASTYTVTFNANGHGTAPTAITNVTSGSKITAPTAPTESGYTFGGWYKEAGCTTAWDFASDTVTAATTLYAKWTASTYTVTFNANGHGTAPDAITGVTSGSKISAPTAPTESGYTFGGWYKEAGCTTAWNFASDTVTANTTLYAKWTASTYTVTFNANGHGTAPADLTGVTSGSKITAPTAPTASGYTFGGWYKEAGCTNQWNFASDTVTAATTLYAKWTANGGNSGSGSSGSSGSTTTPTTGKAEPVIVDNVEHDIGTKTTTDTTTTVTVDNSKLQEQLESAKESVIVPITTKTDTTVAQLVVKNVEDMAEKDMTLSVDIGKVQYNIPSTAVQTDEVMQALGATDPAQVPVNVTITQLKNEDVTIKNGTLQVPPVQFTVTATYGGKTVETSVFTQYVSRVIELSDGTDLSKITTAVVKEPDGAERHVPTFVSTKDGKQYAKINSLTNSTYALIYNQASFADAAGKWYENIVSEMASREILMGRDTGAFDGDASITRAEFAAVLVRALGLPTSGTSKFTDVASTDWFSGAVGTASGYGLVLGYTDGSFGPNKNITRQEAMAMMQRAAKVAEFGGKTSELTAFSDANDVSDWAKSAAQYNVGSGLIVGDNGQLRPADAITRAESATVVLRLLQKAGLVDVRSAT